MVFLAFLTSLGFIFFPSSPFGEKYANEGYSTVSASYHYRYTREKGEYTAGAEFSYGKSYTKYKINPKASLFQTSHGSTFVSVAGEKKITLTDKILVSGYIGPAISFIQRKDKDYSSGALNFSMGVGVSYLVTKRVSLEVGLSHISNANITQPNDGIDSLMFKVNFRL
jgi:hypothetical protein